MPEDQITSVLDNYEKLLKNELDEFDVHDEITRIRMCRYLNSHPRHRPIGGSSCGIGFLSPVLFCTFGVTFVLLICFLYHVHLYTAEVKVIFEAIQGISESQ
jgi:hypothetical protein